MLADLLQPGLIELGKIKIGIKDPTERQSKGGGTWRAPKKLDHFIITTMHRDERGDLRTDDALMKGLEKFADRDGKLRQLPIALLSNEPDQVMQSAYVRYSGKKLAERCDDAQTLYKWYEGKDWLTEPKAFPWKPEYAERKDDKGNHVYKLHSTFNCVIAAQESRWGGVYKFRTTSRITAKQLYGSLMNVRGLTGGVLMGLPMRLVVRPLQVSPNGQPSTVYVVHVELRGPDLLEIQKNALSLAQFQVENVRTVRKLDAEYKKLLTAPGFESPEEIQDIKDEFHPEEQDIQAAPAQPSRLLAMATGKTNSAVAESTEGKEASGSRCAGTEPSEDGGGDSQLKTGESPSPAPVDAKQDLINALEGLLLSKLTPDTLEDARNIGGEERFAEALRECQMHEDDIQRLKAPGIKNVIRAMVENVKAE